MRRSLSKEERLRSQADIARVFDAPDKKTGVRGAKLVARRNEREANRFAVALVRKYGNAVMRNRSRRILKEIYRNAKQDISTGFDIIVVLYPGEYGYGEREQQFRSLIRRADLVESVR